MRIQEGTNTTLTTCTKMTEEVDRRHGVNGNSSKSVTSDAPVHSSPHTATGGRLKFFKDGKFILELVRGCAREGERAGWVSVPRKTFWPPAAAPPTPPAPTHAPSACLSVSDDNSSIQSSPWQRDHCWKQTTPRRNISKELTMYYCRPNTLLNSVINAGTRAKRRRPYDMGQLDVLANGFRRTPNGICDKKRNGDVESPENKGCRSDDVVDGTASSDAKTKTNSNDDTWTDFDREKYYHMKLKKPYQYHKLRVYKKTRPQTNRKMISRTVDKLREKIAALPIPVNAKLASCRQEHMMVSPRKRILRELERVSLEDQGTKRRAKTVPTLSTASYPPSPGPSHTIHKPPVESQPPRAHNGIASRKETVSKNVSSYSIHSLLSMPEENPSRRSPEPKRSPHSYPASLKTESPSSVNSPDLSPSPDNYRYRYSSLALGSPGQERGAGAGAGTTRQWAQYRGSPAPEEWREVPYVYGFGYGPPPIYRPPPPLWMHYAMPAVAPGPWAPLAHPLLTDHIPKEEPTSDLPLNLSKH